MKKSRVYLAAVIASAALLLAGCPTPKGPPAPTALGAFQKYLTATITPTVAPTSVPVAQSPTPALPPPPESACPGVDLGTFGGYLDGFGDTTGATAKFPRPICVSPGATGEHVYSFTIISGQYLDIHADDGDISTVGMVGTTCGAADIIACFTTSHYDVYFPPGTYYLTIQGSTPGDEGDYAFYIDS